MKLFMNHEVKNHNSNSAKAVDYLAKSMMIRIH